jgi:flagellar protein FlaJ
MSLKKSHILGIAFGAIFIVLDLIFFFSKNNNLFVFILGISIFIIAAPFVATVVMQNKKEEEVNGMFLEFTRNLAESVNTGTPISRSIINMRNKNYGSLTPYVQKLANQIDLGVPVHRALQNFAFDVNNEVISRAVALIEEADRAGGEIDYILASVAQSISEVEKLKKEKRAAISNLVVQGYIIFFIFIIIMLVIQFKILPLTQNNLPGGSFSFNDFDVNSASTVTNSSSLSPEALSSNFLYLLLVQGFFAGLTIGKLSEGTVKAGIKHSFVLTIAALLLATGARLAIPMG